MSELLREKGNTFFNQGQPVIYSEEPATNYFIEKKKKSFMRVKQKFLFICHPIKNFKFLNTVTYVYTLYINKKC